MRTLLPMALLGLLAGCTAERAPATNDAANAPSPVETPAPSPVPAPAAAPVPQPDTSDQQATFAGYGDMKFGMASADMEKAWGGELKEVGKDYNASCYFLTPMWVKAPAELNFMISDGRFARVGTESAKVAAPGGGKVGMTAQALQSLYNDALQSTPHKYVDGGRYLSINASGVAPTKLVFELDAAGKVTEWRVGLLPEVDYVEGCS